MEDDNDKQGQIDTLQATVSRLQEQMAALLQAPPPPPPVIPDPPLPQQIPPIPQQIPPIPQHIPPIPQQFPPQIPPPPPAHQNPLIAPEDWFNDPMTIAPAAPVAPVAPVLDQATRDKLAKIDRLEEAMRTSKGFEGYALDLEGLFGEPRARLPDKFKMPDLDKFDGIGNPISHLRAVSDTLQSLGLSSDQIAVLFPRTLTSAAREWYHLLEPSITQSWKSTVQAFIKQYEYNLSLSITLRDLENTYQGPLEGYSDFLLRWRTKASRMVNRPDEEEQVRLVMRNLRAEYVEKLEFQGVTSFQRMDSICVDVEDAIRSGKIKRGAQIPKGSVPEVSALGHRRLSNQSGPSGTPRSQSWKNSGAAPKKHAGSRKNPPPERRFFDELGMPLTEALEILVEEGYLQKLDPKPVPDPIPPHYDINQFCAFHQNPGHNTIQCLKLSHMIQNLIDAK